jgi:hypothetical protein
MDVAIISDSGHNLPEENSMRFAFIKISPSLIPGLRVTRDKSSNNLATLNDSPTASNAYFTSGDIVMNYNKESGEVLSFDGYLPYFDTIPVDTRTTVPHRTIPGRLFVGDLSGNAIFSIDTLALHLIEEGNTIHAGWGKSSQVIKLSEDVYIGLKNESIVDIYLRLG